MEKFRELIRGWLGKVLLVLFLAPLAIGSISEYFGRRSDATAFTVNDEKISQPEYEQWLKSQQQKYLQAAGGDSSLLNNTVIEKQVYEAAVLRALLLQQAEKSGITLTDSQIGSLLRQMPELQENGKFSQAKLDQLLAANQMTVPVLLSDFRKQTVLNLLTNSILASSLTGPREADAVIDLLAQERSAQVAEVPLSHFAQNFVATPAQIQAYYQKNSTQFVLPAAVDVEYVVFDKAQFAQTVQVTEADIQQQYQQYSQSQNKEAVRKISHILIGTEQRTPQQALARAQEVAAKMKAGTRFDALVQQYSDDLVSKTARGQVEGYAVGMYGQAFDQAVLALTQGQVSAPIKTDYGYHLIRLDELSQNTAAPLVQVREQMIAEAKKHKTEQIFQDAVNAASDLAAQTDDLKAIASQYRLPLQSAKTVTATGTNAILSDAVVKNKLFSPEVIQGERTISAALTLKNGNVVWVKPQQYYPQRIQSLVAATPRIQALLLRDEQIKQATASVQPLLQQLNSQPFATVAAQSAFKFQNLGAVPRFSQTVPLEVEKAIYATARPTAAHAAATTTVTGNALYVVAVTAVGKNPQFNLPEAQRAQVLQRFSARGASELNDYLEYLRSTAKISKVKTAE